MTLLPFTTLADADFVNKRAFEHVRAVDDAQGARWSAIYTNDTLYGITFSSDISPILTETQLASVIDADDTWVEYVPPTPDLLPSDLT